MAAHFVCFFRDQLDDFFHQTEETFEYDKDYTYACLTDEKILRKESESSAQGFPDFLQGMKKGYVDKRNWQEEHRL